MSFLLLLLHILLWYFCNIFLKKFSFRKKAKPNWGITSGKVYRPTPKGFGLVSETCAKTIFSTKSYHCFKGLGDQPSIRVLIKEGWTWIEQMFALLGIIQSWDCIWETSKRKRKKKCLLQNVFRNFKTNDAGKEVYLDVATENTHLFPTEFFVDSEDQTKDLSSDTRTYWRLHRDFEDYLKIHLNISHKRASNHNRCYILVPYFISIFISFWIYLLFRGFLHFSFNSRCICIFFLVLITLCYTSLPYIFTIFFFLYLQCSERIMQQLRGHRKVRFSSWTNDVHYDDHHHN